MRDSSRLSESNGFGSSSTFAQTQQARAFSSSHHSHHQFASTGVASLTNGYAHPRSPPAQMTTNGFSPSHSQQLHSPSASHHVQRPQTGIAPVPKEVQPSWQAMTARGAYQYQGDTFRASMAAHLPTQRSSAHASGPQHDPAQEGAATLQDAPHRQAWSIQPTYRWFKRSDYDSVPDRWCQKEGLKGRGDNWYRPLSIAEQQAINARVERRMALVLQHDAHELPSYGRTECGDAHTVGALSLAACPLLTHLVLDFRPLTRSGFYAAPPWHRGYPVEVFKLLTPPPFVPAILRPAHATPPTPPSSLPMPWRRITCRVSARLPNG